MVSVDPHPAMVSASETLSRLSAPPLNLACGLASVLRQEKR